MQLRSMRNAAFKAQYALDARNTEGRERASPQCVGVCVRECVCVCVCVCVCTCVCCASCAPASHHLLWGNDNDKPPMSARSESRIAVVFCCSSCDF